MPTLDLTGKHQDMVRETFARHAPGVWAWAYGSRVRGLNHAASDLDLVVRGPGGAAVSPSTLGRLRSAFAEGNLPISVDLCEWSRLPPAFQEEIGRACVLLVEGVSPPGAPAPVSASPAFLHPNPTDSLNSV